MVDIHTFGDSHCLFGWDVIPNIKKNNIRFLLCYSFGKDKLARLNIKEYNVKDGDIIIFCTGEIDCRCHIHKHITDTVTYQSIIDGIVDDYMDAVKINIKGYKDLKVCIYNVPPPYKRDKPFIDDYGGLYIQRIDLIFPFLGTDNDRKEYTLYFNKKLKEKCVEHNFIFFDVYDKYTDKEGFLNEDYSDKYVHINNGVYIHEFYKNNLLQYII